MWIIYGDNGHSMRDATPIRVDKRDLDANGRPTHITFALGPKCDESAEGEIPGWVEFDHPETSSGAALHSGERAFDHVLTEKELEQQFPGYGERFVNLQRVGAIRRAVSMAAHDDEIARMIGSGALKASDVAAQELKDINARRALRKMPAI